MTYFYLFIVTPPPVSVLIYEVFFDFKYAVVSKLVNRIQ